MRANNVSGVAKASYQSPAMEVIVFPCANILTVSDGNEGEWDPLNAFMTE